MAVAAGGFFDGIAAIFALRAVGRRVPVFSKVFGALDGERVDICMTRLVNPVSKTTRTNDVVLWEETHAKTQD